MPTVGFSTGAASRCLGDPIAEMRRKTDLPTKLYVAFGRQLGWRQNLTERHLVSQNLPGTIPDS